MRSWKIVPIPVVALLAVALLSLVAGLVALQLLGDPVRAGLPAAPSGMPQSQAAIKSAGVEAHGAKVWHNFDVRHPAGHTGHRGRKPDGTRVKVGIIDDNFKGYSGIAPAEVPSASNNAGSRAQYLCWRKNTSGKWVSNGAFSSCEATTPGSAHSPNHGTHVAEVVMDMAPEVELYLSNPPDEMQLYPTVEWMRGQEVEIIVHSIINGLRAPGNGSSVFEKDAIGSVQKATSGTSGAILWVNSGGNNGERTWQGIYDDGDGDGYLSFHDPLNLNSGELNTINLRAGEKVRFLLRWDDTWSGSSRTRLGAKCDLDIVVHTRNPSQALIQSEGSQNGQRREDPYEVLPYEVPAGQSGDHYLAIKVGDGGCDTADRPAWVQLQVRGTSGKLRWASRQGPLADTTLRYHQIAVPAETASDKVLAVGASNVSMTTIESYSSRGPTSANYIMKPDLVAVTCVNTATGAGDADFCGTSAAAPHVAGMAALVKGRYPAMNAKQIADYLKQWAIPRRTHNQEKNNVWGHGVAMLPGCALEDLRILTGRVSRGGSWTKHCTSSHRAGRYAKHYSFTLNRRSQVQIDLSATSTSTLGKDTYLFLKRGAHVAGAVVAQNDNVSSSTKALELLPPWTPGNIPWRRLLSSVV